MPSEATTRLLRARRIDARRYPWGWTQLDFSEEGWVAAAAGEGFRARRTQLRASNPFGEAGGWQLVARSIPSNGGVAGPVRCRAAE